VYYLFICTLLITMSTLSCAQQPDSDVPEDFIKVWETWNILKDNHLNQRSLDSTELSKAAVEGMLKALDDPYAWYVDPTGYAAFQEEIRGSYEGIGASVALRNNQLIIVSPFPDSPAAKAGLRRGDVVLAIDDEPTMGLTLDEAVSLVRGIRGTTVGLTIRHTDSTVETLTIVRGVINTPSVDLHMHDNIPHITIRSFAKNTDEELAKLLQELKQDSPKGIILDVRNNLGGDVDAVVKVTDQFLDGGLVFYQEDGKKRRQDYVARPGGLFTTIPLVVLVNEFSASGSEVLAAALQANDRATIVGTKTYGKGSVGIINKLSDGSGINFTIARWHTPTGDLIEGIGLTPDMIVPLDSSNTEDIQLDAAIEIIIDAISSEQSRLRQ